MIAFRIRRCVAGCALAANAACVTVPSFAELDRDGNGSLSREEFSVRSPDQTLFERFDVDGNERISPAEYESPPPTDYGRGGAGGGGGGM